MIPSRHQRPPIDKHNDTPKPGLDQIAYILWGFSHRFNMSYESFIGWEGQRWRFTLLLCVVTLRPTALALPGTGENHSGD